MSTVDEKLNELPAVAAAARSREAGWTERNGFRLGDAVRLPSIDCTFEVVDLTDESLIGLRAPSGRIVRAGWRVLERVQQR